MATHSQYSSLVLSACTSCFHSDTGCTGWPPQCPNCFRSSSALFSIAKPLTGLVAYFATEYRELQFRRREFRNSRLKAEQSDPRERKWQ